MLNAIAKPFGMLLMWLYELVANYGIAVILFALVVKIILLPFQMKSKRGTMQQARLQPRQAEIQKKHGANKQKYNEELQKLYKEEGVNPASGCIWGLLPFPILIALYQAIRFPLTIMMGVGAELL
ncbi:MAG: membrane protein insertase YidC, partial [Clostridiales bacterium]|nr:membrane protein insertase YidC [Clostridiales bacterium]